ncbi:S8 family serine peptidase [Chondrinema litorale]|uniref:S8 family serine peptidase n=1 Tax=Chondrinema litorale TaxID=2994555 RepID=UPI002543477E|nr:S8 family serine peptidase [Chondrinema litorale]UZR96492.1 S8 family serine peptidase [Chondrinema litorale]
MEATKLLIGGEMVTLYKVSDCFAVFLRDGGKYSNDIRIVPVNNSENLDYLMEELRQARGNEVISHLYNSDMISGEKVLPLDTITVQFKDGTSCVLRFQIFNKFGLEVIEQISYLPRSYTVRLTSFSKRNPLKIVSELRKHKEIKIAEPDLSTQVSLNYIPSDTLYKDQWYLNNSGGTYSLKAGADVKAEGAWKFTKGVRSVRVCIIDNGFNLSHPDLVAMDKIVAAKEFGSAKSKKDITHGTACALLAVAEENGQGMVGLAPKCSLMPLSMPTWLSDNIYIEMLQYAMDNFADVISCSWSTSAWNFPLSTKLKALLHKVSTEGRRNKKGCIIIFAAGNENRPINGNKDGHASHHGFAIYPDVIAVGASNSLDRRASFSNYGKELTVCAPSYGFPGKEINVPQYTDSNEQHQLYKIGGTSCSTALVAGLVALVLSVNPDLSSSEVKRIIIETADKIDLNNANYDTNGHSEYFGFGRINAQKAVEMAMKTKC